MAFPVTPSTPPPRPQIMESAFFWTEEEEEEPVQLAPRPLDQYFQELAAAGLQDGEYLRTRGWFIRDEALQARVYDLCVVLDMGPQINVTSGDFRQHLDEITMAYLTRIATRYPVPAVQPPAWASGARAVASEDTDAELSAISEVSDEDGEEVVWWANQATLGDEEEARGWLDQN
jgi:hypothetical protein